MTSALTRATTAAIVAAAIMSIGLRVSGQANPSFEVASVKPNKSGDGRVAIGLQPGGRFTATNVPLRELIRFAYQVQPFQIVGGPGWLNSDRFDINAKAEGDVAAAPFGAGGPPGPLQLMMRSLLAERFKLVAHTEMRDMPIYNLVVARPDGRLGDKIQPSTLDCVALNAAARRGGGPPPAGLGQRPQCGIRLGPGSMAAGGVNLNTFANAISPLLQRVVTNKTGLTGNFEFDLQWTPDQLPQGPPPAGAPPLPPVDPNGPTIFTALQEQLGLKLESARGPVEVLVIDSAEPPTPD
jgi:uncharacterized protein (TIGR03435 family)